MSAGDQCRVCLGFTHPLDVHGTGCPNAPVSAGDRDTLAELIALFAEHRNEGYWQQSDVAGLSSFISQCSCGSEDGHAAHVADVILSSDWLREQRAEAWEAGHGWCDDGIDGFCFHEPFTPSPYLED